MSDDHDDWQLATRIGAGDDDALNLLMARYRRPVFSFVYRMLGDAGEAEDVAQDVFVRTYRALRTRPLHPSGSFSTWLFQVAHNAAIDRLRHRQRRPETTLDEAPPLEQPVTTRTAAGELAAREIGAQIAAAVAKLPEAQRAVLILAEYEGQSPPDIAAILQCSQKSVETRLYRARQFLRERLAHLIQ